MLIINDETKPADLDHPDKGRGRDRSMGRGASYSDVAQPFPTSLLIPRSEWQARIQEMEEQKSRLSDLCDYFGLKVKDQARTSYCWCNAPTHATEIVRTIEHETSVDLSAASVGAQITGYRNQGGMGADALAFIVKNGIVPTSLWPMNAIDQRYATPGNLEVAKAYRIQEWWELEPGNVDQLVSCLLMRMPCAIGLDWWGHEVTYVDPVWLDGAIACRFDNSWGTSYGTNGRGVLQGNRMVPSDAVVPRTAMAS